MKTLPKPRAAKYLGYSTRWLELREAEGKIYHTEKIGRHRHYAVSDLDKLKRNTQVSKPNNNYKAVIDLSRALLTRKRISSADYL